jgi:hypothetical protein
MPPLRRIVVGLAVLITLTLSGRMFGQTEKAPAETKSASKPQVVNEQVKTRGAGEQDSNIKNNSEKNDPSAKAAPPASKSGKRGAGPYECGIHVDNRTAWFARIYVDGNYVGTVNRYGDLAGITGNGATTVYAVAPFDNAPDRYWGPHVFNCSAGDIYTWKLGQ